VTLRHRIASHRTDLSGADGSCVRVGWLQLETALATLQGAPLEPQHKARLFVRAGVDVTEPATLTSSLFAGATQVREKNGEQRETFGYGTQLVKGRRHHTNRHLPLGVVVERGCTSPLEVPLRGHLTSCRSN
jgi:hypothetical protein